MIVPQVSLIQLISPFPVGRRPLHGEPAVDDAWRLSGTPNRWLGFIQPFPYATNDHKRGGWD